MKNIFSLVAGYNNQTNELGCKKQYLCRDANGGYKLGSRTDKLILDELLKEIFERYTQPLREDASVSEPLKIFIEQLETKLSSPRFMIARVVAKLFACFHYQTSFMKCQEYLSAWKSVLKSTDPVFVISPTSHEEFTVVETSDTSDSESASSETVTMGTSVPQIALNKTIPSVKSVDSFQADPSEDPERSNEVSDEEPSLLPTPEKMKPEEEITPVVILQDDINGSFHTGELSVPSNTEAPPVENQEETGSIFSRFLVGALEMLVDHASDMPTRNRRSRSPI